MYYFNHRTAANYDIIWKTKPSERTSINPNAAGASRVFLQRLDNARGAVLISRGKTKVVIGTQVKAFGRFRGTAVSTMHQIRSDTHVETTCMLNLCRHRCVMCCKSSILERLVAVIRVALNHVKPGVWCAGDRSAKAVLPWHIACQ
jgi:hypothetical protein